MTALRSFQKKYLGLGGLWLLMVFCLLTASLLKENVASIDLWGKLAIPAIFFQSGSFPVLDDFSFTASHAHWTDHEWLSGFAFYFALLWGGDSGLSGLKLFCLLVSLAGVFACTRRQGVPALFTSGLLLGCGSNALVTGFLTTGRPQIFTFAFLPWFLYWLLYGLQADLETSCDSKRKFRLETAFHLVVMLFLGWVWGNLHAGFVVGLGLLGVTCLWGSWQKLISSKRFELKEHWHWLYPLAFVLGVSLNPYGLDYWHYILYAITLDRMGVSEWAPVDWDNQYFLPSIILLLLLSAGLLRVFFKEKRGDKPQDIVPNDIFPNLILPAIWFVLIAYFGFRYIKHQPLFILGGVSLTATYLWCGLKEIVSALPQQIQQAITSQPQPPRLMAKAWNILQIAVPVVGILFSLWEMMPQLTSHTVDALQVSLHRVQQVGHRTSPYPVEAVRYMKQLPHKIDFAHPARLITPFSWGEYVFWELYPHFQVSLDGRLEAVYPMEVFHQHRSLYLTHRIAWPKADVYRESGVPLFLLTETRRQVSDALPVKTWRLCYQDPVYSVYQAINSNHGIKTTHQAGPKCPLLVLDAIPDQAVTTDSVFWEAVQRRRFQHYLDNF
jgi:hypothetical protein